jgi:hypothetical protein
MTNERTNEQKRGVKRTTIILVAVALTFYLGFILVGVLSS